MIIVPLTYKHDVTRELIHYIARGTSHPDHDEPVRIFHNIYPTDDLEEVIAAFAENDTYRKRRKNGVVIRQEIMSFTPLDTPFLSDTVLFDLVHTYLGLRAPHAVAFGQVHRDQEHVHIHLAITANEFRSSKATRLNNSQFRQVRSKLEQHQKGRYPELESVVYERLRSKEVLPSIRVVDLVRDIESEIIKMRGRQPLGISDQRGIS